MALGLDMQPEAVSSVALCSSSVLAWLCFCFTWTGTKGSTESGKILLPESKLDSTLSYDKDVQVDVDQWKRAILYRKLACLITSALAAGAWMTSAWMRRRDLALWLQVAFWVSYLSFGRARSFCIADARQSST